MNLAAVLALAAGALALTSSKPSGVYEGGTRIKLRPGTYRLTMRVAPFATSTALANAMVMPHMTIQGLGGAAYFESLKIDPRNATANWTMTALYQYGGQEKEVDLLPGMTLSEISLQ